MLSKLKRLFNRAERSAKFEQGLDDVELSWLETPADPLDIAAWDRYWTEQVRHGLDHRCSTCSATIGISSM